MEKLTTCIWSFPSLPMFRSVPWWETSKQYPADSFAKSLLTGYLSFIKSLYFGQALISLPAAEALPLNTLNTMSRNRPRHALHLVRHSPQFNLPCDGRPLAEDSWMLIEIMRSPIWHRS